MRREEEPAPEPSAQERESAPRYVIMHREELGALHERLEALARIEDRLGTMEEALSELATRPPARFDFEVNVKERGRR